MNRPMSRHRDIALIHPPYHRRLGDGIVPPIGLGYLSSSLRESGFSSEIIDCSLYFDGLSTRNLKKLRNWLQNELSLSSPRIAIGVGPCTTSSIRSILVIADTCREVLPDTPLIFGGPLSLVPRLEWLFFERLGGYAVVKGDGEHALSQILAQLQGSKKESDIVGVQRSRDRNTEPCFIEDLDSLPYPAWDLFKIEAYKPSVRRDLFVYPVAPLVSSRGCPYRCSFCFSGQLIKYRKHSLAYLGKHIRVLREYCGVRSLIFYDDNVIPEAKEGDQELKMFADSIFRSATDILWQIDMRPDVFSQISDDTLGYAFSRGCRQINIGIEKGCIAQLEPLCKSFDTEALRERFESARRGCPKMRLTGTFILGGPKETVDSVHETINFSTHLGLLFAHYYPLELYPGTPSYYSVFGQDHRIWFDKITNDKLPWGEIIYEDSNISARKSMDLVSLAYHQFYHRPEWKELARSYLGPNYKKIFATVRLWEKDRFRLEEEDSP